MAGVKGRSGRKPNFYTVEIDELLKKSNYILNEFLDDRSVSLEKKVKFAIELIKRRIPDKLEMSGEVTFNISEKTEYNEIKNRLLSITPS